MLSRAPIKTKIDNYYFVAAALYRFEQNPTGTCDVPKMKIFVISHQKSCYVVLAIRLIKVYKLIN